MLSVIKLIILESKFPVPNVGEVKQGHMENAVNIPFTSVFKEDSVSFKSKEDLQTCRSNIALPSIYLTIKLSIDADVTGWIIAKLC